MNAALPAQSTRAFSGWDNPMGTDGFEFIEYAAPDPKATGPLNVWVRGAGDSSKAYQAIFDKFTAATGIPIVPFFTLTDFETKVSAAATSHTLPDVVVDDAAQ